MRKLLVVLGVLMFFVAGNAMAIPILGGESPDLQDIFNNITVDSDSSVNVTTDALSDAVDSTWDVTASGGSFATMIIEVAGWANTNTFGVYSGVNFVELFSGSATTGTQVTLSIDDEFNVYKWGGDTGVNFDSQFFGYYMTNAINQTFYSDTSRNVDQVDHMLAYQGTDTDTVKIGTWTSGLWTDNEFILAFEDTYGGGDQDYQDMVLMVESVTPVPEPGTLLLLGSGLIGLAFLKRRKQA